MLYVSAEYIREPPLSSPMQDVKAKRNDFPPATDTWADGPDRWNMDMFNMEEDFQTIHCNQLATMIVIHKSSYGIDGAGEYEDAELNFWLTVISIHHPFSAVDSQYQNVLAEKFLDTIGNGIRAILLQSNLPVEFWGLAALYIVESYNVLQHSGINNKIPFEEHTGRRADVSWFQPFGCCAMVFRGKDHIDHHKISPWGEPGVFVGLGTAENKKAWLVYAP
eukprot:3940980-Rhodomonas_salina.1